MGSEMCIRDSSYTHRNTGDYKKPTAVSWINGCKALERRTARRIKDFKDGKVASKILKNKWNANQAFTTARNKHKRRKYSRNEEENDCLYFKRCKQLVRLNKTGEF